MTPDINKLYSAKRTGTNTSREMTRSIYRRDYDRIIFSSAFRRLQNKTQVFPLPGSVFVHNRLTHSLEVASVGRSLAYIAGEYIENKFSADLDSIGREFYLHDLQDVVASACLCHDIGNPSFGHSGEDAIAEYFRDKQSDNSFKQLFTETQWSDLTNFEGNANAIRCLTSKQLGKESGGLGLTYSTLAAILKYPCSSSAIDREKIHRKKFGYLQADREIFLNTVNETSMKKDEKSIHEFAGSQTPDIYFRHPFVWLVEAADDICYNIIDMEDAHRLRIIDHNECVDIFTGLISEELNGEKNESEKIRDRLSKIEDKNAQISYLRAKIIGYLIRHTGEIFKENFQKILDGTLNHSLYDITKNDNKYLSKINDFSYKNIYNHRSVVEIENAGYNVIKELLQYFIFPALKPENQRKKSEDKAVKLIPDQFLFDTDEPYMKVLGVIDYISGMTDNYAVDLYRRMKGIETGITAR